MGQAREVRRFCALLGDPHLLVWGAISSRRLFCPAGDADARPRGGQMGDWLATGPARGSSSTCRRTGRGHASSPIADPYRRHRRSARGRASRCRRDGEEGAGFVAGFRYGLFAPGKSRIVIDYAAGLSSSIRRYVLEDERPRLPIDSSGPISWPSDRATFLAKPAMRSPGHGDRSPAPAESRRQARPRGHRPGSRRHRSGRDRRDRRAGEGDRVRASPSGSGATRGDGPLPGR